MKRGDYILFRYRPNKSKIDGLFDEEDRNIYINEDLGKICREFVYIHEAEHKRCFENKLKCWENLFWCEYYAFRAELNFVLEKDNSRYWHKYFTVTIKSLIKFKTNANNIKGWEEHFKALRKVCRLKDFKKFAKKYKYWKLIKEIIEVE
jgi:hypothetical protein